MRGYDIVTSVESAYAPSPGSSNAVAGLSSALVASILCALMQVSPNSAAIASISPTCGDRRCITARRLPCPVDYRYEMRSELTTEWGLCWGKKFSIEC